MLCFSTGELFLYQNSLQKSEPDNYGQFKEAGLVSGNILASKWSPNQEYYVVVECSFLKHLKPRKKPR